MNSEPPAEPRSHASRPTPRLWSRPQRATTPRWPLSRETDHVLKAHPNSGSDRDWSGGGSLLMRHSFTSIAIVLPTTPGTIAGVALRSSGVEPGGRVLRRQCDCRARAGAAVKALVRAPGPPRPRFREQWRRDQGHEPRSGFVCERAVSALPEKPRRASGTRRGSEMRQTSTTVASSLHEWPVNSHSPAWMRKRWAGGNEADVGRSPRAVGLGSTSSARMEPFPALRTYESGWGSDVL